LRKIAILGVGVVAVIVLLLISSFAQDGSEEEQVEIVPRQSKIPENAVKATPETDLFPPQLHSNEYAEPVPMPGPVNTAGAEDSPFITPDGSKHCWSRRLSLHNSRWQYLLFLLHSRWRCACRRADH